MDISHLVAVWLNEWTCNSLGQAEYRKQKVSNFSLIDSNTVSSNLSYSHELYIKHLFRGLSQRAVYKPDVYIKGC